MRSALACAALAVSTSAAAAPSPAGKWLTSVDLAYSQLPTMEMEIEKTIHGAASLDLAPDGTASACIGTTERDFGAISHYQSSDHKDHSSEHTDHRLIALRGHWTAGARGVELAFDRASWNSCTPSTESYDPALALHCTFGDHRLALPAGAEVLVCSDPSAQHAYDLGFAFEVKSDGPVAREPVGEWVVFGRDPGVSVRIDLPARERQPKIAVAAGAAPLVEAQYREPKPPTR